jgi:hypothetical protein
VLVEPAGDKPARGSQVDMLHLAVPHRLPPGIGARPKLDPAARFMADASLTIA